MVTSGIGKILVVDDEVELKNILVEALASQGYEVSGFTSGEGALAALREEAFDVLLTDLMMPEMDGITLLRESLQIDPHLVAIMMTGQGTIQTAVDAMKVGAFDYVLKPFRLQTVLPVLTRAMNTRHMRLENLQLRETLAIYELAQTIAFTLDQQTVISKLADAALEQTDADEVSVLLPTSENGNELYVATVRGENRERLLGERVPLDESISGWVAREREPLILAGEVNDKRFRSLCPHPEIRSAISIPMQVANKLVGTINLNALSRPRPFTLGQMKALTILASTAAAALESASLYGQVRRAEENYRSIFENAVEGIFRSTLEGRFITVNPSMARILGYDSPEELIAKITDVTHQLYVHPESRAEAARLQGERGILQGFEFEAYRKDGEKIWLSLNRRSVRDENGIELYREGSIEDITERKNAGEALRASEAEMRALFTSMTDVIIVFDDLGRHLKIAPTKTPHLYKPVAERIGKTIHEVFPKEKADFFLAQIRQALNKGRTHRVEYSLSIDERELWYDASISPMTENSVIWVARDITERKQAEEERARLTIEIEKQRERLDSLVSSVPGVVWEAWRQPDAATQRIDFVSDYVESMLGYSVDEWLSTPNFWLTIVHPEDRDHAAREATNFAAGKNSTVEFRWIAKDGHAVWVESNYVVIKDDEGRPIGLRGVTTDISERKRAEAELRFQKTLLESQTEASIDGILVVSGDREILSFNQRFVDLWDIPEIVLGSRSDETVLPWVLNKLENSRELLDRVDYIYQHPQENSRDEIQLNDGRTFDRYSAPIKSAQDEYHGRVWFFRDITERKRAEETLRETARSKAESLALLDTTLSSAPIGFAFHNRDLVFERINESLAAINGLPVEEHIGRTLSEVLPEMAPVLEPLLRKVLNTGEPVIDIELTGETPADPGHQHYWLVSFYPVRMQGGEILGVGVLVSDVTARKQAEQALRESEERYRDLVENAHDIIFSHDLDGNYTSVNKAGQQITGYTQEECLKLNIAETITPEGLAKAREMIARKLAGEKVTAYELEITGKDGRQVAVEVNTKLIVQDGVPVGVQGIARDVSERKQLEEQLRQSQKMEAIGQLAGGVAHDFNNLLTVIGGYSELLLRRLPPENPLRTSAEEIKKASDRAGGLTRQLLAFSRKQILQPTVLDLNSVVSDLEKMLRRLIGEDIDLLTINEAGLGKVKADPGQIEQVIMNLAVNARDAMPNGGQLTIRTSNVYLSEDYVKSHVTATPGNHVMLAISDNGCGMDLGTKDRIFEPFFTTKATGKGTGLGLSTVYGIVRQSGGNIWVYSEVGTGTTFKIYLPRVDEPHDGAFAHDESTPAPQGTETILLVEDEEQVRRIAHMILETQGYQVLVAENGEEALTIGRQHEGEIDLMITDVVMPQMGGRESVERLSPLRPRMKILYMSGYTDDAIVRHGLIDEQLEFIEKPFTAEALARKVRTVLDMSGNDHVRII